MRSCVLVLLAACDPLAGGDYVGEPLFTLEGTLSAPDDRVGGVALLWQDPRGAGGPGIETTAVPVTLAFPAAFRVSIPSPPPSSVRFELDGIELAEAYIYAVADPTAKRPEPRGLARTHVVVFAASDVPDGSAAAAYLGGPLAAGYHLRAYTPATAPRAQATLVERCVAAGWKRRACEVRRAYELAPAADDEALVIQVRSR